MRGFAEDNKKKCKKNRSFFLRKVLTVLLTVALATNLMPVSDYSKLWKGNINAYGYSNVSEYPDFDIDIYVAGLMCAGETGEASNILSSSVEWRLQSVTPGGALVNAAEKDTAFKAAMTAWEVATFEPSEILSNGIDQIGYYEAIILSTLKCNVETSYVKDICNNEYEKDFKKLFSTYKQTLKISYGLEYSDLKDYDLLSNDDKQKVMEAFSDSFNDNYSKTKFVDDGIELFSFFVEQGENLETAINNVCAYIQCYKLTESMKMVVTDLYNECDGITNPYMKQALLNIKGSCESYAQGLSAGTTDFLLGEFKTIFGKFVDDMFSEFVSASVYGVAFLAGQAIGKNVADLLFSTDAVCEQYYKLEALVSFENLLKSVVRSEMNLFKSNKTKENANRVLSGIELLYSEYDLSCEMAIEYANVSFNKGISGLFGLHDDEFNEFYTTVNSSKNANNSTYKYIINEGFLECLKEEYPDVYNAYVEEEYELSIIKAEKIVFAKESVEWGLEDDYLTNWQAVIQPSNATFKNIQYESSDTTVAEVDMYGAKVYKAGEVVITAKSVYGDVVAKLKVNVVDGHGEDGIQYDKDNMEKEELEIGEKFTVGIFSYEVIRAGEVEIEQCESDASGKVIIPNYVCYKGHSLKVTKIGHYYNEYSDNLFGAFECCSYIEEIELPRSITEIESDAFSGCTNLKMVKLPNVEIIGSDAFSECTNLDEVKLSNVKQIGSDAFSECTNLKSLTLSENLNRIGSGAFFNCNNLEKIYLPLSLEVIESRAFFGCTSLTKIEIPRNVSGIGTMVFANCTNLKSIEVSKDNYKYFSSNGVLYTERYGLIYLVSYPTGKIDTAYNIMEGTDYILRGAFYGAGNLKNVNIPEGIIDIEEFAFKGCVGLESVKIPSVWSLGSQVFSGCINLKHVDIAEGVRNIGYKVFEGCSNLEEIKIPRGTDFLYQVFAGCDGLKKVELNEGTKEILVGEFDGCSSLEEITIPESVTKINSSAFRGCSSLEEITIPESVTEIKESAFYGCSSLEKIIIPEGVTEIKESTFYGCSSLKKIIIPSSVTKISNSAFRGCSSLEEITIPESVTEIKESAFEGCSSLEKIIIPEGVTEIKESTFYGCSSLKKIIIPNSVTKISSAAFRGCSSLEEITISESVTEINEWAFEGCSSLEKIIIPESITEIDNGAFSGCSGLKEIIIPKSVKKINSEAFYGCSALEKVKIESGEIVGGDAFAGCSNLKELELLEGVIMDGMGSFSECNNIIKVKIGSENVSIKNCKTVKEVEILKGVTNIKDGMFSYCSSLEKITIPEGVTQIGDNAFFECTSLKNIVIPEGVTQIGDNAFFECSSLEKITIPEGVTQIGDNAFFWCTSLEEITIPNETTNIGRCAFGSCSNIKKAIILGKIGEYAFSRCSSLKEVKMISGEIAKNAFDECNSLVKMVIFEDVNNIEGYLRNNPMFVIYGKMNSYAETYANTNSIPFVFLNSLVSDDYISVIYQVASISDNVILKTKKLTTTDSEYKNISSNINKIEDSENIVNDFIVFDITLVNESDNVVQPSDIVTVKIPIPKGYDGTKCKVYRLEDDGTFTDMNAMFYNDYIEFETEHFSKYVIAEMGLKSNIQVIYGDANGDGKVTTQDAVLMKKYLAGYQNLGINESASDVNCDGKVTSADTVLLLKKLAGYDVVLGK